MGAGAVSNEKLQSLTKRLQFFVGPNSGLQVQFFVHEKLHSLLLKKTHRLFSLYCFFVVGKKSDITFTPISLNNISVEYLSL